MESNIAAETIKPMAQPVSGEDILNSQAFHGALSIAGTLSWATPAGPFVSAGISLFEMIIGGQGNDQAQQIVKAIHDNSEIVIKAINDNTALLRYKDQVSTVRNFQHWFKDCSVALDSQDISTFVLEVTQPGGLLTQINDELSPKLGSLYSLVDNLMYDDDLDIKGKPYKDTFAFNIAKEKLNLLIFSQSIYLYALKIKMNMIGLLYYYGFDDKGQHTEDGNPDNTFAVLDSKAHEFSSGLPNFIAALIARRQGMVVTKISSCRVATSKATKARGHEGEWNLTNHQGQKRQYDTPFTAAGDKSYFVTDAEDGPSPAQHKCKVMTVCSGGMAPTCDSRETNEPILENWQRKEVVDKGRNNRVVEYFVSTYTIPTFVKKPGYTHQDKAAQKCVDATKSDLGQQLHREFDVYPSAVDEGILELGKKQTPHLPENFGKLTIQSWSESAAEDGFLATPGLEVKYWVTLSTLLHESSKSSDATTSEWMKVSGKAPVLTGWNVKKSELSNILTINFYRAFQVGKKHSEPRLVKKMIRNRDTGLFPNSITDDKSTMFDSKFFNH